MKRALIYTTASLIGLMLAVGGTFAQRGHGGGHGGGGHGGGHGGGGHGGGHGGGGHGGGGHGGMSRGGAGQGHTHSPGSGSKQHPSAANLKTSKGSMKGKSASSGKGISGNKKSRSGKPNSTAKPGNKPKSPSGATGNSRSNASASGKPKPSTTKNPSGSQTKRPNDSKPSKKPDTREGNKIKDIAGKVTSAIVIAALGSLADGIDPGSAGIIALDGFLDQDDCPLDVPERVFLRERMSVWTTSTSDGDLVIVEEASENDDSDQSDDSAPWQNARYLQVKNDTGEKLTIYVQIRTEVNNAFTWLPADPETSKRALVFELQPGEDVYLPNSGDYLNGCRLRLWAKSASGLEWTDYKEEDLWLVPECNAKGEHFYNAAEMETFSYTFEA
jgi:hypothetical protein